MCFSVAGNVAIVAFVLLAGIPHAIVNSMDPLKYEEFPNYIWIYLVHHMTPNIALPSIIAVLFIKKPDTWKYVKREVSTLCSRIFYFKR